MKIRNCSYLNSLVFCFNTVMYCNRKLHLYRRVITAKPLFMMKCIALLLVCIPAVSLKAQHNPLNKMLEDSVILKHKIKQVKETGWGNDTLVFWTTIEDFDNTGRIIHRTSINHSYHKALNEFVYNDEKKTLKVNTVFKEWMPRPKKGDTAIKRSTQAYTLKGEPLKKKVMQLRDYPARYEYDNNGRIASKTDTIKCGHIYTHYNYDSEGKITELRYSEDYHERDRGLTAIDSFFYNNRKQVIKTARYSNFNKESGNAGHYSEVIFKYNDAGLLIEKTTFSRYFSLIDSNGSGTKYTYDYAFYH